MVEDILDDPTLMDPDEAGSSEGRYHWGEDFQRHIISLLINDRQFLLQSLDLIKPDYFTNKAHQKAAYILFDYFKLHRTLPPKFAIIQEFKTDLKDNKSLSSYLAEVNTLYDYFQPGLDSRDYLTAKIQYFAKMQAFRKAFHEGLKLLDNDPESESNWQKIYDSIEKVITTSTNFEIGTDYFKTIQDRYAMMNSEEETKDRFITGYTSIDTKIKGGGYSRGELISIVAGSGVGKSVCLACITARNLYRGKRGVYITLELAESKVAERFDSIMSGMPIYKLFDEKDEVFHALGSLKGIDYDGVAPLIIKQFPAGTATVNTIAAYISQLRFHGYDPDFVVIDYVGEMADMPGVSVHESRSKTVRDLRGLASKENIFMMTAMQPNRDYKKDPKGESARIDEQHLADAFGQIRPLDGCISLNQNELEQKLGIGRGFVVKQRDGESRFQFYLKFNKETLEISEISLETYKSLYSSAKQYAVDDVKVDNIVQMDDDEPLPPVPPKTDDKEDNIE